MPSNARTPGMSATARIYEYLQERPNQVVHAANIARDLNLARNTVDGALAYMTSRKPEMNVSRVEPAMYMYKVVAGAIMRPDGALQIVAQLPAEHFPEDAGITADPEPGEEEEKPVPLYYEHLGETAELGILARDEPGNLYKVIRLTPVKRARR